MSRSRKATFAVLAAGAGAFSMLQSLIAPVLPTIQHDLHTDQGTVTWVLTAYLLSAAVFTPMLGRVGDMVGKERMLVVSLGALALGCLVAALAPNVIVLVIARIVQGAGGAVFPLSFSIIRDEYPPERLTSAVGTMSAVIAAGGGFGIVTAGPVVVAFGYRSLFWISVVIVGLTALAARRFVPPSPLRTPGRINWLAIVLLAGWLVTLLLPVSEAPDWGWGSPRVVGLLTTAVLLFTAWILVELRSANPFIDMRMMRLPAVWTTNLVAMLFGAGMFATFAFLPQFVQTPVSAGYGFGATVTEASLLMLPMPVGMFVAGVVSGRVDRLFGPKVQLAAGSLCSVVACSGLALLHDARWQILGAAATLGFGVGLVFSATTNLIVRSVPAWQTSSASGMNVNIRTIGGCVGAAAMSTVVTGNLQPSGLPYESGFTNGFAMLTGIAVVAVLAALAVPSGRRPSPVPPRPAAATPCDAPS